LGSPGGNAGDDLRQVFRNVRPVLILCVSGRVLLRFYTQKNGFYSEKQYRKSGVSCVLSFIPFSGQNRDT